MKFNSKVIDAARVYSAICKSVDHPDSAQSLESWQNNAIATRQALLEVERQIDDKERELSSIYQPEALKELMSATREEMKNLVIQERIKLTNSLDAVLNGKMEKYKSVGLSAPSSDQSNLLVALSLRDDLTEAEVNRIAEENASCHQFVRSLKSIAKKSGINLISPPPVEDVEDRVDRAREFADSALRDIVTPDSEMGYFSRCFYAGYGIGPSKVLSDLDETGYTQVAREDDGQPEG